MPGLRPRTLRASTLGALLAVAACSSDSTAPRAPQPLDVSRLLPELTPPFLGALGALVPTAGLLPAVPVTTPSVAGCAYDAAQKAFVCPPTTVSGLTVAMTYTLLDAAGNPQAQPDARTTAAIHSVTTVSGTLALPSAPGAPAGSSMTLSQRQETTLRGLLTDTHLLDGTTTATMRLTPPPGTTSPPVTVTLTETTASLALPASSAAGGMVWPKAGTITMDLSSAVGSAAASTVRTQIVFDGTGTASVTITVGGVTQHCTVNLAAPSSVPSCTG